MQTLIGRTPVLITYRMLVDISAQELIESLDLTQDSLLSDVGPHELHYAIGALVGWYYAACHPGCLPDSDFCGPYITEADALQAATEFFTD